MLGDGNDELLNVAVSVYEPRGEDYGRNWVEWGGIRRN